MNPATQSDDPALGAQPLLIEAAGVADANRSIDGPASVLLSAEGAVLAAGSRHEVEHHEAAVAARRFMRPESVIVPGFVNAHTHLDLTSIGPRPFDPEIGFGEWLARMSADRPSDAAQRRASADLGTKLSRRAGVVALGDIAGSHRGRARPESAQAMAAGGLIGVSYAEFFAIGNDFNTGLAGLDVALSAWPAGPTVGVSPHAPFTVEPRAVEDVIAKGHPLLIHLAESLDERTFVEYGTGPIRSMLDDFSMLGAELPAGYAAGAHPIELFASVVRKATESGLGVLLAHCNDVPNDELLEVLASTRASVAYCPRGHADFRREDQLGPHRYRDMLDAGINVCLGTDSIVNLGPRPELPGSDPLGAHGMGPLDDMRLLFRRDGADAFTLLDMATRRGAVALGLDPDRVVIRDGVFPLGLVAVPVDDATQNRPVVHRILRSEAPPEPIDIGRNAAR
ncbi:MAG: amidohydrolase family protein [Planctomycetota bacterium]